MKLNRAGETDTDRRMLTHLLYTRVPRGEHISDYELHHPSMSREYGLKCASEWRKVVTKTVLYTDHGVSSGMQRAEDEAHLAGQTVERRSLKD